MNVGINVMPDMAKVTRDRRPKKRSLDSFAVSVATSPPLAISCSSLNCKALDPGETISIASTIQIKVIATFARC